MFCRKCGGMNPDGAPACAHCGASVEGYSPAGAASAPKPQNYLPHAIISTLCCCLPFGIVSIVYASQVDSKWNAGDFAGAQTASDNAKQWFWIAMGSGLVVQALGIALQIMVVTAR